MKAIKCCSRYIALRTLILSRYEAYSPEKFEIVVTAQLILATISILGQAPRKNAECWLDPDVLTGLSTFLTQKNEL